MATYLPWYDGVVVNDQATLMQIERYFSTWWRATTYSQWGENIPEQAVAWGMDRQRGAGWLYFLASTISRLDPTWPFPSGLCERWGLPSGTAYSHKQLNGSNRKSDCRLDQPLLQNVWHEVEYIPDVCRATHGAHIDFHRAWRTVYLLFTMVRI
jgi:hypothetical protein